MVAAMSRLAFSIALVLGACSGAPAAHPTAPVSEPAAATPAPSPCDDVALGGVKEIAAGGRRTARVIGATEYDTTLRPLYVVACGEDGWNADQIACWDQPGVPTADIRCPMLLSPDQQQKLTARMDEGARAEREPDGDSGRPEPTGIAACDQYQQALGAFLTCAALSTEDRDEARREVETMTRTWQRARRSRVSDREEHALEAACRRGLPLLEEASKALSC
jgi:hypothetical protein